MATFQSARSPITHAINLSRSRRAMSGMSGIFWNVSEVPYKKQKSEEVDPNYQHIKRARRAIHFRQVKEADFTRNDIFDDWLSKSIVEPHCTASMTQRLISKIQKHGGVSWVYIQREAVSLTDVPVCPINLQASIVTRVSSCSRGRITTLQSTET